MIQKSENNIYTYMPELMKCMYRAIVTGSIKGALLSFRPLVVLWSDVLSSGDG